MKKAFVTLFLLFAFIANAQTDCQITTTTAKDGSEIKSTSESLMYENVFGSTSNFIFFSLTKSNDIPILNFQLLTKSNDFLKIMGINKASRIYLQLMNGKIITLISITEDNCSNLVYDEGDKKNIRVLTGTFLFTKGSLEELEVSPIAFMRVKYGSETLDYPVSKQIQSEIMKAKYYPENYFINNLKCIK